MISGPSPTVKGDVAKHDKHKLVVPEAMVHNMAPTTKQNKFAAYEAPIL
jgi:hypothetical protein